MSLRLTLDAVAGDRIEDVCNQLQHVADLLNVTAELKFNDVRLWAYPGGNALKLANGYYTQASSKETFKYSSSK